ncbi:O-antigen ligase family protein [Patescibacteria group bacterium]|nr:O-antigen ligase family protein [Patescibacteria group bacterium]
MLNHKKTQKVLLVILEGLIYLSFLMPFVFLNKSIFPFIVGKMLYFQGLVQLMAVVYLLLLVVNFQQFRPKKSILLYWFYFYATTLFLSAVFGVDFNRAFWSNFERMTGVFVVFHFIVYSIIVSVVFDNWKKIKRAIQVLLGVSLIQAGVVGAQYVKKGVFLYDNIGGRVWGTLGNSIYIGSYFLFHIFFALLLAFKEKKQLWQILYISIAILETYIIVHSRSSRGADMALLFGIVFIVFAYVFLSKNKKIKIAAITTAVLGILFLGGLVIFKDNPSIKRIPVVGDLVNVSLQEGTGRTRAIAWEIGIKTFKERPILGLGLENFYYAFNKYYNPESLLYSYYETWFDRSHSIIFDTLATGGAIGFISYFGLFVAGGVALAVAWRKKIVDKHIFIFFCVIFSTYLIQLLFVFDHPGSLLLFYFSFGLLLALAARKGQENVEPKYALTYSSFFVIAIIILAGFLALLFSTSIKTYKAAVGIIDTERVFVGNYKIGLQKYKEVLSMKTPFIDDMRLVMAKRVAQINPNALQSNPDYKEALLFAREELIKQTDKNGIDVYYYIILGQIDMLLSFFDNKYLDSADKFFAQAKELSPKRQQIYYTWSRVKTLKGDMGGAEELLKQAMFSDERIADSHWYLALFYDQVGKGGLAWEYLNKAIDRNYSWKSQQELSFALALGEKLGKDKELVRLYSAAIKYSPSAQLYLNMGRVYGRLNEQDKAIEAFKKAQELDPEIFKEPLKKSLL